MFPFARDGNRAIKNTDESEQKTYKSDLETTKM